MSGAGHARVARGGDLGLRAWGVDLPDALDQAVRCLAGILAGPEAARALEGRPVHVAAGEPEAQLVALLEDCLYRFEVEGWLAAEASLSSDGAGGLCGALRGEPFDALRHGEGCPIKAVTWHHLSVASGAACVVLTATLDC